MVFLDGFLKKVKNEIQNHHIGGHCRGSRFMLRRKACRAALVRRESERVVCFP